MSERDAYQKGFQDCIDFIRYKILKHAKTIREVYEKLDELESTIKQLRVEDLEKELAFF
ncbi:MAG: hypothetical protein J7L47_03160 [Candidatus Odinarchaeota archaeon]|nr:hypothetical protein [Candidatus Odinarchaeota archaeon]